MASLRGHHIVTLAVPALLLALASPGQAHAHDATVVGPGDSIQAAVDAAAPGDTIVVVGRHRENVAIVTDGLTLRGVGAVIVPPATPRTNACFDPTQEDEAVHGICLSGVVDFETGEISRYVEDVTVSGFTVRNFTGSGIKVAAARDATITGNIAANNFEAGIDATGSPGARLVHNVASGTDRAAFFLFRSPGAALIGNVAKDSRYGIQIGDTLRGRLLANSVHGNCVGVVMIADANGPAGEFRIVGNRIRANTRACPGTEDAPAVSGAGVVLLGASGNTIVRNQVTGNVPTGDSLVNGGLAITSGLDGTPPNDNVVKRNRIADNDTDIFWDETGLGNVFRANHCRVSAPASLCR